MPVSFAQMICFAQVATKVFELLTSDGFTSKQLPVYPLEPSLLIASRLVVALSIAATTKSTSHAPRIYLSFLRAG
jgi:hypothetical protein